MRWLRSVALCLSMAATASVVQAQFVLASFKDIEGNETYRAMSEDEFRVALREVDLRQRHFRTALQDARREWRENEDYGRKPFPSGISAPSARILRRYAGITDAQEALEAREERDARSEERRQEAQQSAARTRDKQAIEREQQRNRERSFLLAAGLTLLNKQMDASIARETARQSGSQPPGKAE